MYRLSDYEQVEHEQIVAARVNQLRMFYRVNASLDRVKCSSIHNLYPDIIVMDEKNNVLFIEEVETEGSVTKRERNEQWIRFSELGYPFHLIVPKSKIVKAKKLVEGLTINKLYYYILIKMDVSFRHVINLST